LAPTLDDIVQLGVGVGAMVGVGVGAVVGVGVGPTRVTVTDLEAVDWPVGSRFRVSSVMV
jgi:hypothetical protein